MFLPEAPSSSWDAEAASWPIAPDPSVRRSPGISHGRRKRNSSSRRVRVASRLHQLLSPGAAPRKQASGRLQRIALFITGSPANPDSGCAQRSFRAPETNRAPSAHFTRTRAKHLRPGGPEGPLLRATDPQRSPPERHAPAPVGGKLYLPAGSIRYRTTWLLAVSTELEHALGRRKQTRRA